MGTYTSLSLDDFDLASSKSAVVPEVMTIFVESDRRARWRRASDDRVVDVRVVGEDYERQLEYATTAEKAVQRLDVMGFTLERCRREYNAIRVEQLRELREAVQEEGPSGDATDTFCASELKKYERLSFDEYVAGFKGIFDRRLHWYDLKPDQRNALDQTATYILSEQHDEWSHFGFLCSDIRSFLRMALSIAPPNAVLRQDVTALVSAGWLREEDRIRDDAVRALLERFPENAPRIVLTEGSSDAEILSKSLAVVFPHLVGYFTFFDFHASRAAGGATQLVSVVKAFAAAGIANRVIAVLDNDTAAHEARRALREVRLPENIALVHYPPLDWLRTYPTLGPSGDVSLDVNGRAASIELYLGRDILTVDGKVCPIQWAGYSQAMQAYQGELMEKAGARERWRERADHCLSDPTSVVLGDWADLRAVWEQIMSAFPA